MHSVGKEPEFTSVFSPPECIWMPCVVTPVYTNSSAPVGPSLPYQRWQCAFARELGALLSGELSSQQGLTPDVRVTENKQHWEQKITGQWLFMETEWQRKTCTLHFMPPLSVLIQRKWHKQGHNKNQCNTNSSWKCKTLLSKLMSKQRKPFIICIQINTNLPYLHAPPRDIGV